MPYERAPASYAEAILETITQPLLVLDAELRVEAANRVFCHQFNSAADDTVGRVLDDLGNGQWNIPELRRLLQGVLADEGTVEDYRVEHDFPDIGERKMLLNASRMRRSGEPDRIVLAITDVTQRERLHWELEGQKEFTDNIIDSVRDALLILHLDLRVHSANESFYETFQVEEEETAGRPVYELGNGQWNIPKLRELLEGILPYETSFEGFEVQHEFETVGRRIMLLNARRLDHTGLIVLAIRDITQRRDNELRQKTFIQELHHRVKNILGNVRALASHTRRGAHTVDDYFKSFDARLSALARNQDLLMQAPSEAADMHDIVMGELEALGAVKGRDFTVEGPALRLRAHVAQPMSMTIHELATNAAKYGALATEAGRIDIAWSIDRRDEGRHLAFNWREHGVTIPDTSPARGFGSQVIEQKLPYMLGGTARLSFRSDGVVYEVAFPLPTDAGEPE
jgi:two-component sensor histidine kinase/PAS domain-containing protein